MSNDCNYRDYIEKQENLPDEVKVAWLAIVSEIRDDCHSYFLLGIHKGLKVSINHALRPFSKLGFQPGYSISHYMFGKAAHE